MRLQMIFEGNDVRLIGYPSGPDEVRLLRAAASNQLTVAEVKYPPAQPYSSVSYKRDVDPTYIEIRLQRPEPVRGEEILE